MCFERPTQNGVFGSQFRMETQVQGGLDEKAMSDEEYEDAVVLCGRPICVVCVECSGCMYMCMVGSFERSLRVLQRQHTTQNTINTTNSTIRQHHHRHMFRM